ncbi:MAG: cytochrome c biogenesis protein CcdA, partial [Spirochaetaceae bacterium]|nr:cytochrome c biogenesis protein CcdA [Spirochaetaceae bacterium]
MVNLSILLAFTAGLFSFLSPCVLPLIPSWLCFLGGTAMGPAGANAQAAVPATAQTTPQTNAQANAPAAPQTNAQAAPQANAQAAAQTNAGRAPGDTALSAASVPQGRFIPLTVSFILGFSAVFVVLSILFSGAMLLMGGVSRIINIAAGIIVITLGLNMIFNFLVFLNYEKRFHIAQRPRGLAGGFLAGAAFGAGWTPCVGPILGSILLLAGQDGQMG